MQKEKRSSSLGSHIEKCVFIGYPAGYKGWKFYNPIPRKVIISERADFDRGIILVSRELILLHHLLHALSHSSLYPFCISHLLPSLTTLLSLRIIRSHQLLILEEEAYC